MDNLLEALLHASAPDRDSYRPLFFRPSDPNDRAGLEDLLKSKPQLVVHDVLENQLAELVRCTHPDRRFTSETLKAAVNDHLKGRALHDYGVWVYYPWSSTLVHLLDEAEFVRVRTDRNRNKITAQEQAILSTKKVGVIGLSVGQSVCLTLALERSVGELRIADYDTLDLSNLNRIRSGVHSLGQAKTVIVAREIAEIDPFLKVTVFPEGVNEGNLDRFCLDGGKLDLLIDECDGVDVKILCRLKAKELRIPVLMDTSDRGMLDVERFDLEPDRPILHGLIDHLDPRDAAKAKTNEEKLPFVLPIAGMDTLSARMKASMLEIESSVTTWPQLASAVVMGGGTVGHVCRRTLLHHEIPSGRWWIDVDEMLGVMDVSSLAEVRSKFHSSPPKSSEPSELFPKNGSERIYPVALSATEVEILVQAGHSAPSGGNCQPWVFFARNGALEVHLDKKRGKSALDPGYIYAYATMGMCLENIFLKGKELQLDLSYVLFPSPGHDTHIATFFLATRNMCAPEPHDLQLALAIPDRATDRGPTAKPTLAEEKKSALLEVVESSIEPGYHTLVEDRKLIDHIADLCGQAERIRFLNPVCHTDMFQHEMRWTTSAAKITGDGIDVETLQLSLSDTTGLRVAADPEAMLYLREWEAGRGLERMIAKSVTASSALLIIHVRDLLPSTMVECGRSIERIWLKATSLDLSIQPISSPMFMGLHGMWDLDRLLDTKEHAAARLVIQQLSSALGQPIGIPFFMMRIGERTQRIPRSLRRPLGSLLHHA